MEILLLTETDGGGQEDFSTLNAYLRQKLQNDNLTYF